MQQFIDPYAGVDEHEHRVRAGGIYVLPQPVDLLAAERMVRPHRFVFSNLDETVKRPVRIFHAQRIFEGQRKQGSDLFARAVGQPVFFHAVNDLLKISVFDFCDLHVIEARAVQICSVIAGYRAGGRSGMLDVGREPPMIQLGPCDFIVRKAGTAMRSIVIRLKNQSFHVRRKCADDALLSLLRNHENIRPPPVSGQFLNTSITIGIFHFYLPPFLEAILI